jgi:cytochrome P450
VHACLRTAIARLAGRIASEELHKLFPDHRRVQEPLPWMSPSIFRSPLVPDLTVQ